jgi:hypothetical protein
MTLLLTGPKGSEEPEATPTGGSLSATALAMRLLLGSCHPLPPVSGHKYIKYIKIMFTFYLILQVTF